MIPHQNGQKWNNKIPNKVQEAGGVKSKVDGMDESAMLTDYSLHIEKH